MTNKEWLDYLAHNAPDELAAWFDAEHVETEERVLDGDTAAQDGDSREQLEADVRKIAEAYNMDTQRHGTERFAHELYYSIMHLLDRQRAITKREWAHVHDMYIDELRKERDDAESRSDKLTAERDNLQEKLRIGWECECRLQAERDELQAKVDELKEPNEYHALQYELASEDCDRLQAQVDELKAERVKLRLQICKLEDDLVGTSDERDNWKANCEDWKNHARAAENACYETMLEREDYRNKFGKCLDYADAIHALMDDEGMA